MLAVWKEASAFQSTLWESSSFFFFFLDVWFCIQFQIVPLIFVICVYAFKMFNLSVTFWNVCKSETFFCRRNCCTYAVFSFADMNDIRLMMARRRRVIIRLSLMTAIRQNMWRTQLLSVSFSPPTTFLPSLFSPFHSPSASLHLV